MPVEKDMPLTEQMKFDLEAENFSPEQIELIEGDTQLDEDGGATISFGAQMQAPQGHFSNLAETMSDGELAMIADELLEAYEGDKEARSDWSSTYAEGLSLMGLKSED